MTRSTVVPTTTSEDRRAALLETLKIETAKLATSDEWTRMLSFVSKLHSYSFRNLLLIQAQCPGASKVAGFKAWLALGRHVTKGQKGIAILAPCVRRTEDKDTGEVTRSVFAFRTAFVFDVSQTQGDDLPTLTVPEVVCDDEGLFDRLVAVAEAEGLTVTMTSEARSPGVRGWYTADEKRITVVDTYSRASQTRTLLHEAAHHFDPACHGLSGILSDRAARELTAESAAFIVGQRLGIDTSEYSAFYVANWSKGDPERIGTLASHVLKVAAALEAAVLPGAEPGDDEVLDDQAVAA